ncbi:MAG: DNA-processing protein DprA [Rhodospirillales bacterium]|nr:DNA-processing protein DprA [Rhodospirillales bacterium]
MTLPEGRLLAALRLARTPGVGPVSWRRLVGRHGSPEAALAALPETLRAAGGKIPAIPGEAAALHELARLQRLGATPLILGDPHYPPRLAALADAPAVLAVTGDAARLAAPAVALVGARNASAGGLRLAGSIAGDLAAAGIAVISGLARGIDAAAHRAVLAGTGTTIAVIAGGLDRPYPPEHAALQAEIAANGAVLAEMPPGISPEARHFPRRNRIIAGLALGVVVVEAALRSGSLITARLAADAGREVFAVPGSPLDPRARGANALLRDGAVLCENAADVLAVLGGVGTRIPAAQGQEAAAGPTAEPMAEAGLIERVASLLGSAPLPLDEVLRQAEAPAPLVLAALLDLELAGRAVAEGMGYARAAG